MSRKCDLTGKKVQFGNKVSHSQRKTRRSFKVNIKDSYFVSDLTQKKYRLRVAASTIRTVEKAGGFDAYMQAAKAVLMSVKAQAIQKEIKRKVSAQSDVKVSI